MSELKIKLDTRHAREQIFEQNPTAQILRRVATEQPNLFGKGEGFVLQDIYGTVNSLRETLQSSGMLLSDQLQILLIMEHPDFYLLSVRPAGSITAIELSTAAKRLHEKTGLGMDVIYKQLSVLCYAVGISFAAMEPVAVSGGDEINASEFEDQLLQTEGVPAYGFVLPPEAYAESKKEMDNMFAHGDFELLWDTASVLSTMSNPTALYYCGYCYLYGKAVRQDPQRAFRLLKAAAKSGEIRAYNALGDYYCSKYCDHMQRMELAYRCYTMFGAAPLNEAQRNRILRMKENRRSYSKNWIAAGIFLAFMPLFLIFASVLIGPAAIGWGIVFTVLSAALYGGAFYLQQKYPHSDIMRYSIPAMYLFWVIYLFIWILSITA